jgi:chromatin modification-related protein VID21
MGRIEQLKQEGRWSFRQPKKQKGPPVGKSGWDWMLEEMVRSSQVVAEIFYETADSSCWTLDV